MSNSGRRRVFKCSITAVVKRVVLLAFLFMLPTLGNAQMPDHSFDPVNPSNPYNLTDLDNFPLGDYGHCKLGNLMSESQSGYLSFTPLTALPYSPQNIDLFLNNGLYSLNILNFPESTSWDPYSYTVTLFPNSTPPLLLDYSLFRKFHFYNSLTDMLSGNEVDANTHKLIILIHGRNPNSNEDQFSTSSAFIALENAIKARLQGSDWQLSLYHWEKDADTGPNGLNVIENATRSAQNGHQHGQHLGELLAAKCPNLKEVQFITHSAGAWAARAAARYLLQNTGVKVQVTLLDPFVPGELPFNNTPLTKNVISAMPSMDPLGSGQLVLLENYFAVDITDLEGIEDATSVTFGWDNSIGVQHHVDWADFGFIWYYDYHEGPVQFYADTVFFYDKTKPTSLLNFDLSQIGWKKSMFYQEHVPPTISYISPATLPPSSSAQTITITGTNFKPSGDPNASILVFYDPANNPTPPRTPNYVNPGQLNYNATLPVAGTWKVKVVNGVVESLPYSFTVASGTAQLTGLSISGPASVNQNSSGQYTATAVFSDGTSSTVTPSTWSLNSGAPASISTSGQLTANSVSANTTVTITANYTTGGITKAATYSMTIVKTGTGGTQQQEFIINGGFELGTTGTSTTGWQLSGPVVVSGPYYHTGSRYLIMGELANDTDIAYQDIFIPANASLVTLSYWYNIVSGDTSSTAHDVLNVSIRNTSGTILSPVDTKSNLNRDSGAGSIYYHQKTFDLTSYKGQTVRVYFLVTTIGTTSFKIDDVSVQATVPTTPTPVLFGVGGPTSVVEGGTAQYNAIVVNSDGSVVPVAPNWSVSGPATITTSGFLTALGVSGDTTATVTANYSGFPALNYYVTILNVAPVFSSLVISGPSSMNGNSSGQFAATAVYSDGSSVPVSANWSVSSGPGDISTSGLLTVGQVGGNTTTTVTAYCTIGNITRSASQQVSIIYVAPPPTFTSLSISGLSLVNENSTAQYSAAALFSDGSSQVVNPTWGVDSTVANISTSGLLSAGIVGANTPVNISASYTIGVITQSASLPITVNVVAATVTPSAGSNGSISPNSPQSVNLGGSVTFNASPSNGFVVDQWLVDGGSVQSGGTSYNVAGITIPITVQVTFKPAPPGTVVAWGDNSLGQRNIPSDLTNAVAVAAGASHNLALRENGTITAWGENSYGLTNVPVDLTNVIAVAAGIYHNLALRSDGTLVSWGSSLDGETNFPPGLTNIVSISAGNGFSVALKGDGTVLAWGFGGNDETKVPTNLTGVISISTYFSHTLALKRDGSVTAWGWNGYGQNNVPLELTNAIAVAAGGAHSLALTADGTMMAWGYNHYGQTNVPPGLANVIAIAAGENISLALKADGTVVEWGYDGDGETNVPVGLTNVVAIAGADGHSLALMGRPLPTSVAALLNPILNGNKFYVAIPTTQGRSYVLEFKNSLQDANWTMLPPVPGDGTMKTLTDSSANASQRFYRVRQQ